MSVRLFCRAVLLFLCTTGAVSAGPRKLALLVGVGQYADNAIPALEGPRHDLVAVRAALQTHWGFADSDVQVLLDGAASRLGILTALARLETNSAPGDHLFIYFSGHGTSANDKNLGLPLPHTSGAFVPWDLRTTQSPQQLVDQLIVGQRDLRPLLSRLDAGGRKVVVVSDSCYSGQAVRALGAGAASAGLRKRYLPLGSQAAAAPTRALREQPAPYPYRNVFYMAAASDSEAAVDISGPDLARQPTLDRQPHGAFTDALLRALTGSLPVDRNHDGVVDQAEVFAAIAGFMQPRGYPHTPQVLPSLAEDSGGLARAALFGTRPVGGPFDSLAVAVDTSLPASAPASQASATAATVDPGALRLRLEGAPPAWAATLQALPGLRLVSSGLVDFSLQGAEGAWQLRGPSGDLVLQADSAALVQQRLAAALWLRRLAQRLRPAFALELEALPASRGGSFVEGERFNLALRSERRAYVLVLGISPQGAVEVLYPVNAAEKAPHGAEAVVVTPPTGSPIVVTPPFGTDELLALAFETPPEFWGRLPARGAQALDSPLLWSLEAALAAPQTSAASAGLLVRTLPALR